MWQDLAGGDTSVGCILLHELQEQLYSLMEKDWKKTTTIVWPLIGYIQPTLV